MSNRLLVPRNKRKLWVPKAPALSIPGIMPVPMGVIPPPSYEIPPAFVTTVANSTNIYCGSGNPRTLLILGGTKGTGSPPVVAPVLTIGVTAATNRLHVVDYYNSGINGFIAVAVWTAQNFVGGTQLLLISGSYQWSFVAYPIFDASSITPFSTSTNTSGTDITTTTMVSDCNTALNGVVFIIGSRNGTSGNHTATGYTRDTRTVSGSNELVFCGSHLNTPASTPRSISTGFGGVADNCVTACVAFR